MAPNATLAFSVSRNYENISQIHIQPMQSADIEPVVELHRRVLGCSLNSRLGPKHLAYVYEVAQRDPSSAVVIASFRDVPVGVVSVTLNPARLQAQLLSGLTIQQWIELSGRLILNPTLALEWWGDKARFGHPVVFKNQVIQPYLTAIAVDTAFSGAGIGRALVGSAEQFFRMRNCHAYRLDTRADNSGANAFYQRLGFVKVEQRGPNNIWIKELG